MLEERVRELRPVYLPPDPASRTSSVAGEIAQCDLWFPPFKLPAGFGQTCKPTQLPVRTMVTGCSGWLTALLILFPEGEDLLAGCWQLLGAKVPRRTRIGLLLPAPEPEVEQWRSADCDTALGLTDTDTEGGVA